jgi:hypothetical protein
MIVFLRNLVMHDFWLKLFSLALASLIWILVSPAASKRLSPTAALLNNNSDRSVVVPLQVVASAGDVHAFKVSPSEVEVTLQGDKKVLQDLQARDIRALVDLTGIESARGMRKQIDIVTPPGVTYTRVVPAEADVTVPAKK